VPCTIDNVDWHSNNDIQNAGAPTSRRVASKNEITSPYLAWVGEKYMTETYQHTLANGDVILGNMEGSGGSSLGSGNRIFDTKVQGQWGCRDGREDFCSAGAWIDCRTRDNCAGRRFVYSMPGKKVNIKKFSLAMAGGHKEATRTGGCSSVKVYYWNDATSSFKNVDPSSISCNLGNGQNQVYQRSYEITMPSVGTSALGFEFQPDMSRVEPNYILQEMTIDGCIQSSSAPKAADEVTLIVDQTGLSGASLSIAVNGVTLQYGAEKVTKTFDKDGEVELGVWTAQQGFLSVIDESLDGGLTWKDVQNGPPGCETGQCQARLGGGNCQKKQECCWKYEATKTTRCSGGDHGYMRRPVADKRKFKVVKGKTYRLRGCAGGTCK
jgi:hypothetical protein